MNVEITMQSNSEDSRSARVEPSGWLFVPGSKCGKWKEPEIHREEPLGYGLVILLRSADSCISHGIAPFKTQHLSAARFAHINNNAMFSSFFANKQIFRCQKYRSVLNFSESLKALAWKSTLSKEQPSSFNSL